MKRAVPFLVALGSGVLAAAALPLVVPWISLRPIDPAGWLEVLAWFALVPAFRELERARSARGALALGLVAGLGYFFTAIYWVSHAMTAFGGLSAPLALLALTLLVLYMAAHWAAAFAVSWKIRASLGWPLWAHIPFVWAAFELCRNYLFTGFPWADVGYTQARTLPVAQLASLTGVYGIAALVVLVNAVLLEAAKALAARRRLPRRLLAGTAVLLAAVVAFGEVHLASVRARMADAPRIRVGIVQPNVNQSLKNESATHAGYVLGRLVPQTLEADRAGADLVAWPEAAYPGYVRPDVPSFAGLLPPLSHAHLLLGTATVEWTRGAEGRRVPHVANAHLLLAPDLRVLGKYVKHHLVPFGEYVPLPRLLRALGLGTVVPSLAPVDAGRELAVLSFTPGAEPPASRDASLADPPPRPQAGAPGAVRLAPMICYDAIFPEIGAAFARQDPDVLVNPTNDAWYGYSSGPYQFLAIVRMRAIEAGRAVVRPAYAGVSAIVLPTGEVAPGALDVGPVDPDLAPDPEEPARLLVGDVPRLHGSTVYATVGDLFAWLCAAGAAAALGAAWRAGRRARNAGTT
jgi:apolipoprotein N-acyltransferase